MSSVSVVVPVLNGARTLPRCLGALERLDPAPLEIILVDNGSTDGSLELLRAFVETRPGARLVEEGQRGAAAARNAGIRSAVGEIVAFTDCDCTPEPAWLRYLTGPFDDLTIGAVAGRVVGATATGVVELFSVLYTLPSPARPARHHRWTPHEGGFPTANLAVRRDLLEALGGFDTQVLIYGEDYDLCARVYSRGCAIAYTPEGRIAHHHRTTLRGMLRQAFGFGRAHAYLLRRHAAGLWVDLPRGSLVWERCPVRAWIDLAAADKKVVALLVLSALYGPLLLLLLAYAGWLVVTTGGRARRVGGVSPATGFALAGLLLLKSAAMTAGRCWGSVGYGAFCF